MIINKVEKFEGNQKEVVLFFQIPQEYSDRFGWSVLERGVDSKTFILWLKQALAKRGGVHCISQITDGMYVYEKFVDVSGIYAEEPEI